MGWYSWDRILARPVLWYSLFGGGDKLPLKHLSHCWSSGQLEVRPSPPPSLTRDPWASFLPTQFLTTQPPPKTVLGHHFLERKIRSSVTSL